MTQETQDKINHHKRILAAITRVNQDPQHPDHACFNELMSQQEAIICHLEETKRWNFNFEGGGWNSVFAVDRETAIETALDEYASSPNLNPKTSTFRVATESDDRALLSLFY